MMNQSENYYSLIKNWHAKASEDDYFARFMFEYMAFIAYLRTQWITESDIQTLKGNHGKVTDRDYIQALKYDPYLNDFWTDVSLRAPKNKELDKNLNTLILLLKKEPLKSDDKWWNFEGFDINQKIITKKHSGILHSKGDFSNLIEFWYSVRNNLFHGEKNPSLERDKKLVEYAFLTLNFFVENILLKLKELHGVYPAIWEDFWERFKQGKAEYTTRPDNSGAAGNIYESLFLKEHRYPLLLLDKQLEKSDLIKIINEELYMSGEMADMIVSKLKTAAGRDEIRIAELKEYFQNTLDVLNSSLALKLNFDK